MADFNLRFSPPPLSATARPALGLALALNILLAAGVHMAMSFATSTTTSETGDWLTVDIMRAAPVMYLALLTPILGLYGIAAAAWTGWSWWRVPFATLAGAVFALGFNAWAMSQWIARQQWAVDPTLSASDPRIHHLLGLAGFSMIILVLVGLSLWPRWKNSIERFSQ